MQREEMSIGRRAASGAVVVIGSQALKALCFACSTIVAARILPPSDFGVIAVMTPITAFMILLQDFGLSQAIVQSKSGDQEGVTSVFYVNVAMSIFIAAVIVSLSKPIGDVFSDGRVRYVVMASSLISFATSLYAVPSAILMRDLKFNVIAIIDIASSILSLIATLLLAFYIRNYWALWWGLFVMSASQAFIAWLCAGWVPRGAFSWHKAKDLISFGSGVAGSNFINYAIRNSDNFIVGKYLGTNSLGLYDQAYKLMMMPVQLLINPIGRVMLPTLGRIAVDEEAYRTTFLDASRVLTLLLAPGLAVCVALHAEIIQVVLGDRWAGSAPIFAWLALTGLIQPLAVTTGWIFITQGRTGALAKWGLFSLVLTLLGFAIGLRWGAEGVAASLFFSAAVRLPILFWWTASISPISQRDMYAELFMSMLIAAVTGAVGLLLREFTVGIWLILATSIWGYLAAVLLVLATPRGRKLILKRLLPAILSARKK